MKTKYLLPNHYKSLGAIMMPVGLLTWCLTQIGIFNNILIFHWLTVTVLTISFFSFLSGMYFLVFSKEKQEDEYITSLRLQSFQLAAFIQLSFFLISFLIMFLFNTQPSHDAGLALFFMSSIFLFWLGYITYFNCTLSRNKKKAYEE